MLLKVSLEDEEEEGGGGIGFSLEFVDGDGFVVNDGADGVVVVGRIPNALVVVVFLDTKSASSDPGGGSTGSWLLFGTLISAVVWGLGGTTSATVRAARESIQRVEKW